MQFDLYNDIATRTGGDIYVGVVGPVRSGKSTFIKRFMDALVIDAIKDKNARKRAVDELPQSGDGKSIMTTQPNFVPSEAVSVTVSDNLNVNVRMIDCVGYVVEGALGAEENGKDGRRNTFCESGGNRHGKSNQGALDNRCSRHDGRHDNGYSARQLCPRRRTRRCRNEGNWKTFCDSYQQRDARKQRNGKAQSRT